jgi:hypothetical protein
MYSPRPAVPTFKHKKRIVREKPEKSRSQHDNIDDLIQEKIRSLEQRVDRLPKNSLSLSANGVVDAPPQNAKGAKKQSPRRSPNRAADDASIAPVLLEQIRELSIRMDQMQRYNSRGHLDAREDDMYSAINSFNLSPRGRNQLLNGGYENHSHHPSPEKRFDHYDPLRQQHSMPALAPQFVSPRAPPDPMTKRWDAAPPARGLYPDENSSVMQRNVMELQTTLQETRNEYMKAMAVLEAESFERQQLERKNADLQNKLSAARQALAVTQTALSGMQDAQAQSGKTREIRDMEIEKYLTELKIKDSKIHSLEARLKEGDEQVQVSISKKDEAIVKLQKKLSDALDSAYRAEQEASTLSKDLSMSEQEVYSLRNRLSALELDSAEAVKRVERECKSKIDALNAQLAKASAAEDANEKSILRTATLEAKNIELEARVKYLDSSLQKWEKEVQSKSDDIIKLQGEIASLTQQRMLSTSSAMKDLEEKVVSLEHTLNVRAEREGALENDVRRQEAELNMYKKRLAEMSTPTGNPQMQDLEYSKGLLEKENSHLKNKQQQTENELQSLKMTLRQQESLSAENLQRVTNLKDEQIRQLYAAIQSAKDENAALRENNGSATELSKTMKDLSDQRDRINQELFAAQDALSASKSRESTLSAELAVQAAENGRIKAQLESEINSVSALRRDLSSATASASDAELRAKSYRADAETKAQRIVELEKLLATAVENSSNDTSEKKKKKKTESSRATSDDDSVSSEKKKKKKKKKQKDSEGSESDKHEPKGDAAVAVHSAPVPVQPTPVVAAPVQPTPVVAAPVQPTPVVAAPVQPTPVVAAPVQPTPVVAAPVAVTVQPPADASPKTNAPSTKTADSGNPIDDIFGIVGIESSPVQKQRRTIIKPAAALTPEAAAAPTAAVPPSNSAEQQGYNQLKKSAGGQSFDKATTPGGSRQSSSRKKKGINVEEVKKELEELNAKKKTLKKAISKWNSDFSKKNGRDPTVDDKSSDPVITEMYQTYHEVNVLSVWVGQAITNYYYNFIGYSCRQEQRRSLRKC